MTALFIATRPIEEVIERGVETSEPDGTRTTIFDGDYAFDHFVARDGVYKRDPKSKGPWRPPGRSTA